MNEEAIDAAAGSIAAKITVGSGAGTALAMWASIDWLGVLGVVVALAGLYTTWHYKRKQDRRAEKKAADDHEESLAKIEYWRSHPPIEGK